MAKIQTAEANRIPLQTLLPEAMVTCDFTEEENQKILNNVFESLDPLRLKVFSSKEKKKIATLRRISAEFESGREYSEKEVNEILTAIYPDFATLRRYLIEYGYLSRTKDCRIYWKK